METNNIGDIIIEHYERFLGTFKERQIFKSDMTMSSIRLLQYDNVFEDSIRNNKETIYFTEPYAFPDEFLNINREIKMYLAFLISEKEYDYIKKYGRDEFEDYLEENKIAIMNINR